MVHLVLGKLGVAAAADDPSPECNASKVIGIRDHFPLSSMQIEALAHRFFPNPFTPVNVEHEELVHDEVRRNSARNVWSCRDEEKSCGVSIGENQAWEERSRRSPPCVHGLQVLGQGHHTVINAEEAVSVWFAAIKLGDFSWYGGHRFLMMWAS